MHKFNFTSNIIISLLNSSKDKDIENALRIILSGCIKGNLINSDHIDRLVTLSISPNYEIRILARHIIAIVGPYTKIPNINKRDVNPFFDFKLFQHQQLTPATNNSLKPDDTVVDTDDPIEFVRPYAYWLGILADQTNIPEINLAYRTYQISQELEGPEIVSATYEKRLRSHLTAIDLDFPMPRPRHTIIRRAIFYLIAELIDCDVLEETKIITKHFDFYDPIIPFIAPTIRPNFVRSMRNSSESRYSFNKDWINSIQTSDQDQPADLDSGLCIIGEYTQNRNLGWGRPTEIFMRQLIAEGPRPKNHSELIFGKFLHSKINDYSTDDSVRIPYLIVSNHFYSGSGDSNKYHWLAINPSFAKFMNWIPDTQGLFRWLDHHGEIMVESVFWEDGNMWQSPPHYDSIAGSGWAVLATPTAIRQIRGMENALTWESKITRTFSEDHNEFKNEKSFTKEDE